MVSVLETVAVWRMSYEWYLKAKFKPEESTLALAIFMYSLSDPRITRVFTKLANFLADVGGRGPDTRPCWDPLPLTGEIQGLTKVLYHC